MDLTLWMLVIYPIQIANWMSAFFDLFSDKSDAVCCPELFCGSDFLYYFHVCHQLFLSFSHGNLLFMPCCDMDVVLYCAALMLSAVESVDYKMRGHNTLQEHLDPKAYPLVQLRTPLQSITLQREYLSSMAMSFWKFAFSSHLFYIIIAP